MLLQLVFEGIRGYGYQGDIAIDDIKMTAGSCAGVGACSFEKDFCGWTQRQDDKFDWIRNSGRTGTLFTGPNKDHTLGNNAGKDFV